MKRIVFIIVFGLFFAPQVQAHITDEPHQEKVAQTTKVTTPLVTEESTPTATTQTSFELFWPLSAGKTREDGVYFLKMFKENLRGLLIFGTAEKANYRVLRATKRMLEAEVLFDKTKLDLATQTVSSSNNFLKMANDSMNGVTGSETVKAEMKNRLDNLIILVDRLNMKAEGDFKAQLELSHSLIESLLKEIAG